MRLRPTLFRRFPTLGRPPRSYPVIPDDQRRAYPSLEADFAVLERVVDPSFQKADLAALRCQNSYRLHQVISLFGSATVTGLGGLQAVFPAQRWPGALLAVLSVLLTAGSQAGGELATHKEYMTERAKAERLRALYFRFLSGTGAYGGPDRKSALARAVLAIDSGREPLG